ncbi:DNA translocase FtsK, partial [Vibrio parahaemolyticus]|nr:DNA translocase FtsK [Vibrio parahaemolyticus]
LNVTIEELEAAAQQADDWGTEEQAAPSLADTYSSYVEQHTATEEPISVEPDYAQYEQFEAEQVQQPSIEHPVHEEPAIDSAVLDSITAQTESSQHIEPTISDFDVLDDEDEVESQPAQQVQPTTPHQQVATPSTTFEPAPQKVEVEEIQDNDQDVTAFQDMVSSAQAKVAATQNPFLVQKEENLPVKELLDAVVTDVEMPRMDGMHLV